MNHPKISIIDYGIGNVKSIINALNYNKIDALLTNERESILKSDGVIFPGVGAFGAGMQKLEELKLIEVIREFTSSGRPLLGICLGMQLLFEKGEEFGHFDGLGIVSGSVKKLKVNEGIKLPHISWNGIDQEKVEWSDTILDGVPNKSKVYFVHSYACYPKDHDNILSLTNYADTCFCSSIKMNNVYGVQFHPEKSASIGLRIISNFINLIS